MRKIRVYLENPCTNSKNYVDDPLGSELLEKDGVNIDEPATSRQ